MLYGNLWEIIKIVKQTGNSIQKMRENTGKYLKKWPQNITNFVKENER